MTKSISKFLAQNRARNDASNRNEFLLSLPEKRRRLEEIGLYDASNGPVASCARTDAKTQNRDLQMKYDIAKNEDGPLRKTMKSPDDGIAAKADVPLVVKAEDAESVITGERYPAFDERLQNLEAHLAVRYGAWIILDDYSHCTDTPCDLVPSPPRSLLDRLKFLEDHLTKLEKEYPPWAALHFNQPHRGVRSPNSIAFAFQLIVRSVASSSAPNPYYCPFSPYILDCFHRCITALHPIWCHLPNLCATFLCADHC